MDLNHVLFLISWIRDLLKEIKILDEWGSTKLEKKPLSLKGSNPFRGTTVQTHDFENYNPHNQGSPL